VILAGDFGQLPPVNVAASHTLLNQNVIHNAREARMTNLGLRLFNGATDVIRFRRVHRQPGASVFKESLIRTRDGAATKQDWAVWEERDLTSDACPISEAQKQKFEQLVHLFAENAIASERNGLMCGRCAMEQEHHLLRIVATDTNRAASRQSDTTYGNLKRVLHVTENVPVMLNTNLQTPWGLVNGAMGRLLAVKLKVPKKKGESLPNSIDADNVEYAVVEIPKYTGPVLLPDHPKVVLLSPTRVRHARFKGWERLQLPFALAYGITIHKSQGLTLHDGAVIDFKHSPNWMPVATLGLAFVGMSRTKCLEATAFKHLPDFWAFRLVLQNQLFKLRVKLEKALDVKADETQMKHLGRTCTLEEDLEQHVAWTQKIKKRRLEQQEIDDLQGMLRVHGVLDPPEYTDEPVLGPRGLRGGGGGRIRNRGMKPHAKGKAARARQQAQAAAMTHEGIDLSDNLELPVCGKSDTDATDTTDATDGHSSTDEAHGVTSMSKAMPESTDLSKWNLAQNKFLGTMKKAPPSFNNPMTGATSLAMARPSECPICEVVTTSTSGKCDVCGCVMMAAPIDLSSASSNPQIQSIKFILNFFATQSTELRAKCLLVERAMEHTSPTAGSQILELLRTTKNEISASSLEPDEKMRVVREALRNAVDMVEKKPAEKKAKDEHGLKSRIVGSEEAVEQIAIEIAAQEEDERANAEQEEAERANAAKEEAERANIGTPLVVAGRGMFASSKIGQSPALPASAAQGDSSGHERAASVQSYNLATSGESSPAHGTSTDEDEGRKLNLGKWHLARNKFLGTMKKAPPWFNNPMTGATSERGTQTLATCGVFALNHCFAPLEIVVPWSYFQTVAGNERCEDGSLEISTLMTIAEEIKGLT
jgi:hypothetical protein